MFESLLTLEKDRSEVVRQITQWGDFRPGSIVGVMGRCGKPNCHCAQAGDPGHGPHLRLTAKVEGKTVAETLSRPAAVRKAQGEVDEFRRFQRLSAELIAVNEKICRLRPVEEEGTGTAEEKTAATIHQEVAREINQLLGRIFAQRRKDGRTDLEAVEMAVRSALHRAGAAAPVLPLNSNFYVARPSLRLARLFRPSIRGIPTIRPALCLL